MLFEQAEDPEGRRQQNIAGQPAEASIRPGWRQNAHTPVASATTLLSFARTAGGAAFHSAHAAALRLSGDAAPAAVAFF